jgi:hypothetical protein
MRDETVFFSSSSGITAIFCAISSNLSIEHHPSPGRDFELLRFTEVINVCLGGQLYLSRGDLTLE